MAEGVEEGLEDPGADPPVAEDVETVDPRGSIETEDLSSKVSNPSDDSNIDSCDSNTQHTDDDTRNTEPMKIQSEIKTSTVPDSRVPDSYPPDNPPKVSPVLPEIISKESEDVEVYVPPIDLSSPLVEEEPSTDVTPPLFSSKSILEEEKKEAEKEVSTTEQSGTGIGFTLGAESKADILDSLAFSIKHRDSSGFMQEQFMDQDVINLADFQSGPPQQLRVGYAGPVTGWSGTDSQAGSTGKFSGRWSGAGNYEEDYGWDEGGGDNISDLLTIRRVDSKDVVYKKKKAAKFVGKYVFGDILGEGSYARVKECVDSETLCRRAVKIMKKRKLRKIPNGEENVRREIALLKSLKHKNVMQLIDVLTNEQKGKIYLVLEYCCTVLQEMLEKSVDKKFPPWQSHLYFTQLLEGLEYLHSKGIIHKDIKPGNLLLDRAEVLKIADFGVCEQIDMFSQNDLIKTSQGTPSFQPPEVATGVDLFSGEKLDIWSCGVTLYNFSTGDYPFQGDTIFKLFENIGKGEFSFHVAVDKLLEDLVTQLLALDPADRPNVKQARQHDWCRKKFPRSSQAVCAPPYLDDPFLSTTVLPYLENHHYPSSEPDLISEHDLNRQEEARLEQQQEEAAELEQERRESKTTSCIKLKNGCKQQ